MGKKTVAEFVEDEATLKKLRELGVDYAQGYHIGRPAALSTYRVARLTVSRTRQPAVAGHGDRSRAHGL
jgi:EAL domain-containing protein (putative c-di-GMP-specific phosphodiesterase class I)